MTFDDIIGQQEAVQSLRSAIDNNRLPHALLIAGPEGTGGLPLAWAAAQYILCPHRNGKGEICGECPDCVQAAKAAHPDLHWVYPVINKGSGSSSVSTDYAREWRQALIADPWMSLSQWVRNMSGEENANKQAKIFVTEAAEIVKTLSTKPLQNDWRILILWMPELLNEDAANKLLKIIEEPYDKTCLMLVSANPDRIIGTIRSRVQRLNLPPLSEETIAEALQQRFGTAPDKAAEIARLCHGSWIAARELLADDETRAFFLDKFTSMMRLSYARRLFDMKIWSEEMASLTRERQCAFLQFAQNQIRENFILNFQEPQINYQSGEEAKFSSRFHPFVNHKNVVGIMNELGLAERDINQNVNSKMVFFDLALRLIMLLKA